MVDGLCDANVKRKENSSTNEKIITYLAFALMLDVSVRLSIGAL